MREKEIESKLVSDVKKQGGLCLKWECPSFVGVPDRIVMLPNRKFGFVELKAPNKKPREIQKARHRLFGGLGFKVYVVDRIEQIGGVIDEIQST